MHIHRQVEHFLREYDLAPTKFGRLAVRDPRLVLDMRNGRQVRPDMEQILQQFMSQYRHRNADAKRHAA